MAKKKTLNTQKPRTRKKGKVPKGLIRSARYIFFRGIALLITVTIGVYLAVLIANMGGYVDRIREGEIREEVGNAVRADPSLQNLSASELRKYVDKRVQNEIERLGLNKPFIWRSFSYLGDALSLSLGRAEQVTSNSGSRQVRLIIMERLPATLLLFGSGQLLLFITAVILALFLSRRYGSRLDKAVIALAPSSAAPGWFYGIFGILIFASILGILPYGGLVDHPPPESTWGYALSVIKHLMLPVAALVIGAFFRTAYNWRTFFLIHSSEDYVEMAKAKGLPSGSIERRYILRPSLPTIITSFALMLITIWMGAIILETVFSWPGLGRLIYEAIGQFDTPVILGSVVIYAYLLALTVFLLDLIYALIDPRVKLGAEGKQ